MKSLAEQIKETAESLPESVQRNVLAYAKRLREEGASVDSDREPRDPNRDPILQRAGMFDVDLGADRIDEELYGNGRSENDPEGRS
jgi:hypothetical protein